MEKRRATAPRSQYRKQAQKVRDPVVIQATRLLLEGNSIERVVKDMRLDLSGGVCREILTYLDVQDAPDMGLEVLKFKTLVFEGSNDLDWGSEGQGDKRSTGDKKNKEIWRSSDEATVLWTKVMKMQMRRRDCGASRALETYNLMRTHGIPLDVVSFNTALAAASTCGKWKKVKLIREDMVAQGIGADAFTYSSLLGGCKTTGHWKLARKLFAEMEASDTITPNVIHYTTLMTTLQRAGAWKESVEVFNKMSASGVKADVVSYNAAITACAKGEDWQQAWSLFSALRRDGIEPSVVSYNALLSACERCGQADRALEVFENMSRRGIACNQVTYNTLISACGKGGRYDAALRINREMKEKGIREDVFTLTGLISACGKAGEWKRALSLVQEFRTMGVKPNVVVYNQVISILGDLREWRRALAAWQSMKEEEGIAPDIVTYGALLSTLEKAGKWRAALDLYDEMLEDEVEPNSFIFASVLNACERGRQWDRATEIFKALNVMIKEGKVARDELQMNGLSILARRAMYASPASAVLSAMPDPLVTTAKSVVDSGRAARALLSGRGVVGISAVGISAVGNTARSDMDTKPNDVH